MCLSLALVINPVTVNPNGGVDTRDGGFRG